MYGGREPLMHCSELFPRFKTREKAPLLSEPWRQCCKYDPKQRLKPPLLEYQQADTGNIFEIGADSTVEVHASISGISDLIPLRADPYLVFVLIPSTATYHKTIHVSLYPNSAGHHARSSHGR
jgi:hypothetical protein